MLTQSKLSSEWIYKYYKELEKYNIENHGLLIMQNGETLYEEYAYPYSKDMPHTLFSVTKSVVSTAAGFALAEGLFTLDSKIIDFFPEYPHCESPEWENLTVRSVLTMQSNKEFTFLQDMTGNYMEIFMKAPFRKDKGFLYSNNDAHVVASLIQKLTGQTLTEYLTPRLFAPLGIEVPFWETNSIGECIGGTGCYLKLEDLAKITQCYLDGGKYKGEQVIPEFWTKEATTVQVDFNKQDGNEGYGYLFWINNGIISMTGMFGQIIAIIPKYNAVVATMNCCIDEDSHTRLLQTVLVNAFEGKSDESWDNKLEDYLLNRTQKPVVSETVPTVPAGKEFYITPLWNKIAGVIFPFSLIPRTLTSSFAQRPKSNIDKISFSVEGNVLKIKWSEEEDIIEISCGLNGEPQISRCSIKGYPYTVWAYAYEKDGVINAVIKPLNTLSTQYATFKLSGNTLKFGMKSTPGFPEFIVKNATSSSFFGKHPLIKKTASKAVGFIMSVTEKSVKYKAK